MLRQIALFASQFRMIPENKFGAKRRTERDDELRIVITLYGFVRA
jgi:hypothetical protein